MRAPPLVPVILALVLGSAALAQDQIFPPGFRTQDIATNGTTLSVRTAAAKRTPLSGKCPG